MTGREINKKIRQAYDHATPDVFDAVLSDCKDQKGRVYVMTTPKNRKTWIKQIAGIAACLCLIVGAAIGFKSYQVNHKVDTTVSLDVNPSIEMQINKKERVLKVVPLNKDGRIIIGNMDLSGSDLDVAVHAIIGSMLRNGYLNELTNSILVSVDNDDHARGVELQERLATKINELLKTDRFSGSVLSQTVAKSDNLEQLAEKYGITKGKAQLINTILSKSSIHTFDELVSLSINELNLLLNGKADKGTKVEVTGTASKKAYIDKAKAKSIALKRAGVSANKLTSYRIEMDADDGIIIYDVDFTAGNYEYDCEIDAITGKIIKFEKEYHKAPAPSGSISGNNTNNSSQITSAKAKKIALKHAGVKSGDATVVKNKLDFDDGISKYELEFYAGNYEYDYEIDAVTGKVIKFEKEYHKTSVSSTPKSSGNTNTSSKTSSKITFAKAKKIALNHAGVSASNVVGFKNELDFDDGMKTYEIEFRVGGYEYEYEINATTGAIIKFDKEFDD